MTETTTQGTARERPEAPAGAGGRPRGAARTGPNKPLLGAVGIVAFLGMWEAVPHLGLVSERFLPPASTVLAALAQRATTPGFWIAVGDTLIGWGLGLAIAFVAAVLLGFAMGALPRVRAFTNSTVDFLRPIPSVALIPLAILLYGTDLRSTLLLVVYACFWLIYIQVLYGVADVDPVAEQTARSYGLGRLARIRYVVWPTTLPYLMTGVRLAAAVALILAITAQLIIGSPGIGQEIAVAQSSGAVSSVYALIVATGALGVLINIGVRVLERRVLRWHTSVRGEATA
ncbi:ABC-type nitrate/sulfonate/bicarbonate transport system permease component [Nocardiopsis arvandica]|uniref:ABC-type nitrate/sulfonate/bicarbonate transport system permease component n=1 Tax=Nocardiopsis sinuspersici TaxID=501010 RepID=A0A7Z0BLB1_9ACTN|nr:ABC transporter permease [Nocardiopsis sinuspersici]NYH55081.1 ABC-type nitrate/sulfonate/bicarbonate transport system permease component [Nocardiopsis sinuspersici]